MYSIIFKFQVVDAQNSSEFNDWAPLNVLDFSSFTKSMVVEGFQAFSKPIIIFKHHVDAGFFMRKS